ncbi:HAD family hydrolase [Nocardiaceae bacterium YC2-7]|uniref:HAD family hydrolase n=1 Tax=Antrihabitans stalactiti TaxID=2584121 RepID=A0A848K7X7_9NOCA|nr:HAD family hydrolase [Antrihabitans stalactiti]
MPRSALVHRFTIAVHLFASSGSGRPNLAEHQGNDLLLRIPGSNEKQTEVAPALIGYPCQVSETGSEPAVLFDIDGTLVDSNYLHVTTWSRAFDEVGEAVDSWRIHDSIGLDGGLLLDALLPNATDDTKGRAKELHTRYYEESASLLRPLSGTHELLEAIAARHLQIVLATSASDAELSILRKVLGVDDIVSAVTSAEDVDTAKPNPDIVGIALKRAGVSAKHAVFVGDTKWDAKACARAGVTFVGLRTGGSPAQKLLDAGAAAVFDDPAQLLEQLDDSPIGRL